MSTTRHPGLDVSVFNIGGDYLSDLENATISVEVQEEDAKAIKDQFAYPWATGRAWTLEADVFVGASAALFANAASGSSQVSISFTTGGNSYAGSGLITSANHQANRGSLQTQKITIKGQGPLTVTAPS